MAELSPTIADLDGHKNLFRALSSKMDKIKEPGRQSKDLEELRQCKRLMKEFDRQIKAKNPAKQLNEKKQSLIKELDSYVALRKTYTSSLGNKKAEMMEGGSAEGARTDLMGPKVKMASTMSNQQPMDAGKKTMDETDERIERVKKRASDRCILFVLLLIVIAVIVVKVDVDGQLKDQSSGFQKMDKIKEPARQSKHLEELTAKIRECKRLMKEFREIKEEPGLTKQLNEKKQSLIKELNSYVALRKTYTSSLENKKAELTEGGSAEGARTDLTDPNLKMVSTMSNQQPMDAGKKTMDETDQKIERVKKLATGRCIFFFLFLGAIAVIVVKVVDPKKKDICGLPGLSPLANTSQILFNRRIWESLFLLSESLWQGKGAGVIVLLVLLSQAEGHFVSLENSFSCKTCTSSVVDPTILSTSMNALLLTVDDGGIGCLKDLEDILNLIGRKYKTTIFKSPQVTQALTAIRDFVAAASAGERLLFYFCGHGTQFPDKNLDELDGNDEALCFNDGYLVDDILHNVMVQYLHEGVHLTAIFDSCHSGTVLDLPYGNTGSGWFNASSQTPPELLQAGVFFRTSVVSISACLDSELSYFDEVNQRGWFTSNMTHYIQEGATTYGAILSDMQNYHPNSTMMISSSFKFDLTRTLDL